MLANSYCFYFLDLFIKYLFTFIIILNDLFLKIKNYEKITSNWNSKLT